MIASVFTVASAVNAIASYCQWCEVTPSKLATPLLPPMSIVVALAGGV